MTQGEEAGSASSVENTKGTSVAGELDWEPSASKSRSKLVAGSGAVVVAVLIAIFALLARADKGRPNTVTAERGTIDRRLLLEGRAQPDQTYSLAFPVPSSDDNVGPKIEELFVKAGDHVSADQILARLEGDRVEAALLRSPTDGVVVEVRGAAGAPPPPGAVIVVRTVDLVAEFNLTEANLSELRGGIEATLTIPVLSRSLSVTIDRLPQDPRGSSSQTTTLGSAEGGGSLAGLDQALNFPLEIPLPRIDGLRPGMTVNLDVSVARKTDVLVLPQETIRYDQDGSFVEVLEGRKVRTVRVMTGLSDEKNIEIMSGLVGGESVVLPTNE